jgi:hypothetical protein
MNSRTLLSTFLLKFSWVTLSVAVTYSSLESSASLSSSLPPVATATHRGCCFYPFLSPLALLLIALDGAAQLPPGPFPHHPIQRHPQPPPRQRRAEWRYQEAPWWCLAYHSQACVPRYYTLCWTITLRCRRCRPTLGSSWHFWGEASNVISEGLAQLLLATLQVLGVAGLHIRALEVAGEDLLEVIPVIDHVSL